ncbi:MAG: helix-turn-helix transcriptional regulator [Clostridia bacterium]|nr:helix-turn-helix transcriptional regulator [Clostridia bacterium]
MLVQNLLLADESYTHSNWIYRDVNVVFSRIYYIIDGEAYYEEHGKKVRFKKAHLYLTPVKKPFTLSENPQNKLLHTYAHITTLPTVDHLIEIPVLPNTPLSDGVALWRKYAKSNDTALIISALQFILSQIDRLEHRKSCIEDTVKAYLDNLEGYTFDMSKLCEELGYTREHITRRFSTAYHVTPKQYFNRWRMEIALEQLCCGIRINVISEMLSFSTPYAFSKAFKQHFGLSPEKYLQTLNYSSSNHKA